MSFSDIAITVSGFIDIGFTVVRKPDNGDYVSLVSSFQNTPTDKAIKAIAHIFNTS